VKIIEKTQMEVADLIPLDVVENRYASSHAAKPYIPINK